MYSKEGEFEGETQRECLKGGLGRVRRECVKEGSETRVPRFWSEELKADSGGIVVWRMGSKGGSEGRG